MNSAAAAAATVKVPAAAAELGLGRRQVTKLIGAGLLEVVDSEAPQPRIPVASVARIARLGKAAPPAGVSTAAVHLAPLQESGDTDRRWTGFRVGAQLPVEDLTKAWTRWWTMGRPQAEELINGYLVGDISGVVPADLVGKVTGYESVAGGLIAFTVEPVEIPGLAWTRFKPGQGSHWQMLHPDIDKDA